MKKRREFMEYKKKSALFPVGIKHVNSHVNSMVNLARQQGAKVSTWFWRCRFGYRSKLHQITAPQNPNPRHLSLFIFSGSEQSDERVQLSKNRLFNSVKGFNFYLCKSYLGWTAIVRLTADFRGTIKMMNNVNLNIP